MIEHSNTLAEISKALTNFSSIVPNIEKKETNPFFKSKYASLGDILTAIKEPLKASGFL
jgi:hypothetical protein